MVQYRMGTLDDLDTIYESYALEFHENERKTKDQLKQLLRRGSYVLLIAETYEAYVNERIGFACLYISASEDFIWLDYLVIERAYQNKGYGSKFFDELMRICFGRKGMFIEVEIPSGEDVNQARRITYYERLGAIRLPMNYHLPTEVDDMAMYLYFKPATTLTSDEGISQEYIQKAIIRANSVIHWDHANLESIWQKNRFISDRADSETSDSETCI